MAWGLIFIGREGFSKSSPVLAGEGDYDLKARFSFG